MFEEPKLRVRHRINDNVWLVGDILKPSSHMYDTTRHDTTACDTTRQRIEARRFLAISEFVLLKFILILLNH